MFLIENLKYRSILDIPHLELRAPVVCITGPSGSGKTTLLKMLNRMNSPDAGRVLYQDRDIAQMNPVQLRREVVMLGQTPVLYPGNLEENLQAGLLFSQKLPVSKDAMRRMLAQVKLDKPLDDPCVNLSGGEKQRLCLARILLMDAQVYLLDEPSAALDAETEELMISNLADFAQERQRQLIMVTHSEQIAQRFRGAVVEIRHGEVKEGGHE